MPAFCHEFMVDAPLRQVRDFHRYSASMGALTPPPVMVQLHAAPDLLGEGDEMDFTLQVGPLPIRWQARIEQVSDTQFTDRQVSGPFRRWEHTHRFEAVSPFRTRVQDAIEIEYARQPLWRAVGWFMRLNLPLLFAYRGWKTRRLLARYPI
ncbi:MAG: hypothetical protein KDD92_15580 [Caldilineaceae bacterium]|nr:hypothetical protein [Caldilineaceae bacterium]